jgi:hypothetical protein
VLQLAALGAVIGASAAAGADIRRVQETGRGCRRIHRRCGAGGLDR